MCFRYGQAVVTHILTDADWPFASRHPVRQVERRPLLDPPGASEVHEHASPGDMKLAALFLEFGAIGPPLGNPSPPRAGSELCLKIGPGNGRCPLKRRIGRAGSHPSGAIREGSPTFLNPEIR